MQVLRHMADRLATWPSRLVAALVPDLAAGNALRAQRLERVMTMGLIALPVAPLALSVITSPAVALPAGVGGAVALTLAGAALAAIGGEGDPVSETQPATTPDDDLRALFENPLYDMMPGLVTLHNARGQVMSIKGRDRTEIARGLRPLTGNGLIEQIHVSDRIKFLQAVDELRQGEAGADIRVRFESLSTQTDVASQFVNCRLLLGGLRSADGDFAGFFAQMIDCRDEQELERQLALRAADADAANEAKSRFLAAVSHELRTPLNAILGFSDILSGEYFGKLENDRQREYVSLINQSGNHLLAVVNTMLDMSKIEAGRYELMCEPFMVGDVAGACDAMLGLQARTKGVTLTTRVPRDAGELVADRRAVQQILINLVGNAIKFTHEGGVVSLDVERRGSEVRLIVSDTGIGIPEDKIELLGRPFMQVQNAYSRQYEGTGLGLSLVKGLVSLHGGRFEITSKLGEGSVMTVILPADGPEAAEAVGGRQAERPVEFPPRLQDLADKYQKKDSAHDLAKAQTA